MKGKEKFWTFIAAAAGMSALGAWALLKYYPTHRGLFPKCFFYEFTGLYCPGCGSTRALRSLLRGEFCNACRYNPLLTLSLPFLLWWIYREVLWAVYLIPRPAWLMSKRFALIVAITVILYFIGRNLPWQPFCLLAPPAD